MRITNPTILRGYNRDLNRLLNLKSQCEKRITSSRKFSRASEAPLSAAKALNVRKSQYYSAQYKENLKVADKFYTEAETSLLQVSSKMAEIRETIIAACNTTKDTQDWSIYAQQLETNAKELCAIFNTDSAGRSIFGGESDDPMPFTIINDSNGFASTVLYHGVPVNAMSDYTQFPYSEDVNLDIGLGMVTNQQTHETDSQSVLRISFNGAKTTGCGAENGVADVDLSSIIENRSYCIDVYAGNVKKTISFIGQGSYSDNITEINNKLKEAYKKDIAYGRDYPEMDAQGVISLKDKDGNPVENGIVCVVNNENAKRTEKLVVDNDSGYTDKYRLKLGSLIEGNTYKIDVTVGKETKTIAFEAGTDNLSDSTNPVYREDITVKNVQAALDAAFGEGKVNISATDPTKGIISSEGNIVKLTQSFDEDNLSVVESPANIVTVNSETFSKLNLDSLNHDGVSTYSFKATVNGVTNEVTFTTGTDGDATIANIKTALDTAFGTGHNFSVANIGLEKGAISANGVPVTVTASGTSNSVTPGRYTNYSIDLDNLTDGEEYSLKFIVGNDVQNITFTAGATAADNQLAIQTALNDAFGTGIIAVGPDGLVMNPFSKAVWVSNNDVSEASSELPFEREAIYSNNYIQLTLDAARALRNGDIAYANGCIDRIVTANENLLVEIADLGCNEEFISFNLDRITTREENLAERQNDLEIADAKSEITLWKTYEALYNACLQMSSSVVPNSIFNYIK